MVGLACASPRVRGPAPRSGALLAPENPLLNSYIGFRIYYAVLSKYLDVFAFFLALIDIPLDTL